MPINLSIVDPFSKATSTQGFAWADIVAFSALAQEIRLVYRLHPSAQAAADGGEPYPTAVEIHIGPTARAAEYGPAPLLDPGQPAVAPVYQVDADGNLVFDQDGNPVIVTPGHDAVPPTYGPAPLLRARVPSYGEVISAHPDLYASMADAVDALAVAVAPEFTGAVVIPRAS